MGIDEDFGVVAAVDGINHEQAAEEEHLRDQENPHAELAGVVLLLLRLEVMREQWAVSRMLAGRVGVSDCRHRRRYWPQLPSRRLCISRWALAHGFRSRRENRTLTRAG